MQVLRNDHLPPNVQRSGGYRSASSLSLRMFDKRKARENANMPTAVFGEWGAPAPKASGCPRAKPESRRGRKGPRHFVFSRSYFGLGSDLRSKELIKGRRQPNDYLAGVLARRRGVPGHPPFFPRPK